MLAFAFLNKIIIWNNVKSNLTKHMKPDKTVPNKEHMQYSVEDFEKAVAAVTDDKKKYW